MLVIYIYVMYAHKIIKLIEPLKYISGIFTNFYSYKQILFKIALSYLNTYIYIYIYTWNQ